MNSIRWCTDTINVTRGCVPVSEGCALCYAARQATRFAGPGLPFEGLAAGGFWTGRVGYFPDQMDKARKARTPQVYFVDSMSDLFIEVNSSDLILEVFEMMRALPQHQFVILTKRVDRMAAWLSWYQRQMEQRDLGFGECAVLPNVWLGFSAENQERFDSRMRAAHTAKELGWHVIASLEPLIGAISIASTPYDLDWVIVGGESGGLDARPMHTAWARDLMVESIERGIPFFFKQQGEYEARELTPEERFQYDNDDFRETNPYKLNRIASWTTLSSTEPGERGKVKHLFFDEGGNVAGVMERRKHKSRQVLTLDGITHEDAPAPIAFALRAENLRYAKAQGMKAKRGAPAKRIGKSTPIGEGVFA